MCITGLMCRYFFVNNPRIGWTFKKIPPNHVFRTAIIVIHSRFNGIHSVNYAIIYDNSITCQ